MNARWVRSVGKTESSRGVVNVDGGKKQSRVLRGAVFISDEFVVIVDLSFLRALEAMVGR